MEFAGRNTSIQLEFRSSRKIRSSPAGEDPEASARGEGVARLGLPFGQETAFRQRSIAVLLARFDLQLLWMLEMGIIFFWIHDESEGRRRTRRLIERTADIVVRLVSLGSLRLLAPLRKSALALLDELREH